MGDLSEKMQERLEKWRKGTAGNVSPEKSKTSPVSRRNSKNDYGDAMSLDEWEQEVKRSQTRR